MLGIDGGLQIWCIRRCLADTALCSRHLVLWFREGINSCSISIFVLWLRCKSEWIVWAEWELWDSALMITFQCKWICIDPVTNTTWNFCSFYMHSSICPNRVLDIRVVKSTQDLNWWALNVSAMCWYILSCVMHNSRSPLEDVCNELCPLSHHYSTQLRQELYCYMS